MDYEMLLNVSIHLQCESRMEKVFSFLLFFFQKLSLQKLFYYLAEKDGL